MLQLLFLITEAIGEKGIKPTATGNLPRKLVREIALTYWGQEYYRERTRFGELQGEADFRDLHTVRIVAEMAGMLRKYKGRIILGRKWRKPLAVGDASSFYLAIFRTFVETFNWTYSWGFDEVPFIQQSFLFSLYLLSIDGSEFRPPEHYAEAFMNAFPAVLDEVGETPLFSRKERLETLYIQQTILGFMHLFGLAEIEGDDFLKRGFGRIRKTPLLEAFVSFNI